MAFKDVLGNRRVKNILHKAIQNNRLPNSLLFIGPEGVGKKETALVVAKALNCQNKSDDACEKCPSCLAIGRLNFPDVQVISPLREVITIDQMRMLKQVAYLRPMSGKKRVFIVEEAEKLNAEAANSLLKVLEEPPLFCYILLLTQNPYLILPTIKSRCQTLVFSPVSKEDIESVLVERGFEEQKARVISLLVAGNLRQARVLDWEDVQKKREKAWRLLQALLAREKVSPLVQAFSTSRTEGKEELEQVFEILSSFLRDIAILKEGADSRLLLNPDYEAEMAGVKDILSFEKLMEWMEKMDYALYALRKNLNVNLLVSSLFSNLAEGKYV